MDITQQELKTMKAKQLRRLIREAIDEVLAEDATADKKAQDQAKTAETSKLAALQKRKTELSKTTSPEEKPSQDAQKVAVDKEIAQTTKKIQKLSKPGISVLDLDEGDIEEMANVGISYVLSPEADASAFTGKKGRIIATMQEYGEPISKAEVARMLGYVKRNTRGEEVPQQQPINTEFMELVRDGVITQSSTQSAPRLLRPQSTTPTEPGDEESGGMATGPEDFLIGNADLSNYFSAASNDDEGNEEDFNTEEEPTAGEIDGQPVVTSSMSDEDYEAFMEYDKLKYRLDSTKSAINKMKRSKGGGVAGDIRDTSSPDIERLQALKKSLEDKISALVASSDYLKKKTGQEVAPPEIEDIEDEEETIAEVMDEYTLRKLQYYAGIRK